jgi:transcriptional regulator with XRE-family HTH domain
LRALRADRGWTQEQLGRRIGVTNVTVSRFESGIRRPSIKVFQRIAESFGLTTDELIKGGGGEPTRKP